MAPAKKYNLFLSFYPHRQNSEERDSFSHIRSRAPTKPSIRDGSTSGESPSTSLSAGTLAHLPHWRELLRMVGAAGVESSCDSERLFVISKKPLSSLMIMQVLYFGGFAVF
jgi:hypothetical protein